MLIAIGGGRGVGNGGFAAAVARVRVRVSLDVGGLVFGVEEGGELELGLLLGGGGRCMVSVVLEKNDQRLEVRIKSWWLAIIK